MSDWKAGERLAVPAAPAVGGPARCCCSSQADSSSPPVAAAGSHQPFDVHSHGREQEHGVSGEEWGPGWTQVIEEGGAGRKRLW